MFFLVQRQKTEMDGLAPFNISVFNLSDKKHDMKQEYFFSRITRKKL